MNEFEVLQNSKEGFSIAVSFENWRIGIINYSNSISIAKKPRKIEKHLFTDEAFILGYGRAVLYIGEEINPIEMEVGKIYNIRKNTWHAILLEKHTRVFVVENEGTDESNTQYKYFDNE